MKSIFIAFAIDNFTDDLFIQRNYGLMIVVADF